MTARGDARRAILSRIRAAQRTAVLPTASKAAPLVHPVAVSTDTDQRLRFERELQALGVEIHHAASPEAVRDTVMRIVDGRRVLSWDAPSLPYDVHSVLPAPLSGSSARAEQAAAEIGVTACDAAVADTGSLVLLSGPGRARTVSLLPPIHLAVVRSQDIVPTLGEAFARLDQRIRGAASCTVITGPSRTADIELTLTLGIHGPGRIVVILAP